MKKKFVRVSRLELTAFVSGFVLMVYELAGARILAPSIGSSTYVWTSVIGIIIAALSLGYWMGGKLADRRGYMIDIARLCLMISLTIAYTLVAYIPLLDWVARDLNDPRLQGVVASLFLFAPASFVLGMLSPYLAKMNVRSLKTTGSSVASLSALNSLGGIVGTFVAGFVLFSYVGSHETLAMLSIILLALSWLVSPRLQWKMRLGMTFVLAIILISPPPTLRGQPIDTPSAHYMIFNNIASPHGPVRAIAAGPSAVQSGIYPDRPNELVFWYTRQMDAVVATLAKHNNILVLGGGTFTLPQHLAKKYPNATVDVVEIDPKLVDISRRYFDYHDQPNMHVFFDDARVYLNKATTQYDAILVDVYSDTHVPFTTITREYGDRIDALTKPDGVVAVNMIAGLQGGCGTLLNALDAPYRAHFANVRYAIETPNLPYDNLIAVYSRTPREYPGLTPLNLTTKTLYTDDHAPIDALQYECRKQRILG